MSQVGESKSIMSSEDIALIRRFTARPMMVWLNVWIFVLATASAALGYQFIGIWVLIYLPVVLVLLGLSLWTVSKFRTKVYLDDGEMIIVSNPPFFASKKYRYGRSDVGQVRRRAKHIVVSASSEHHLGYGLSKQELETFHQELLTWLGED